MNKKKLSLTSNKNNIIAMIAIKGITMVISFLYVPLLLHALDTDAYAIWLTLSSIIAWIIMFDIGLGNGLRNRLSEAIAKNEDKAAQVYVSTAYISMAVIGIFLLCLFAGSIKFLNWQKILNADNFPKKTIDLLVLIVGVSFILQFIGGLINSVLLALKYPALSSLISCIGQVISYVCVLIVVKIFNFNNLLTLCSIISIVPVFILIIANIIFFNGKYSYLRPKIKKFDKKQFNSVFVIGLKFFWLQIITIILFQFNNFIITHTVDTTAVVQYNICYKYLYTIVSVYIIICTPFWSASTHEFVKGNLNWIKITNNKLLKIALLFSIVGLLMVFWAPLAYKIWLGSDSIQIQMTTNWLMLFYCVFMMIYSANGYIINGIGKLKIQTIITTFLAIVYLPTAFLGGKYWGLNGVIIALIFNSLVNSIWSSIQLRKIVNGSATGIWIK